MSIDYARMVRMAQRVGELVNTPDVKTSVRRVYEERAKAELDAYLPRRRLSSMPNPATEKKAPKRKPPC